ncbi:MAG TPA: sialidase family protein [Mobilitalea sp.]|nr:sialidase family protein [Mobilitalea sp.]
MNNKRNVRRAIALAITVLLWSGLLSSCGFNTKSAPSGDSSVESKLTDSRPSSQKENSDASSAISNAPTSAVVEQDEAATFMKIEPTILKTTQSSTYTYVEGKLSFTIGTDTADFPPKYVSTIFNPHDDFIPSSIFVSENKIAVVRTPDEDSIVITYSDDDGKAWQDSDAIHTEQIPDHATSDSDFLGKNEVNQLLSLYVDFPSKTTGFLIIGAGTIMGTQYTRALFKTTDGGKTWYALDSNIAIKQSFPVTGMYFMDDKNGFIVQSGVNVNKANICQTTDGGVTWSMKELPVPVTLVDDLNAPSLTALVPYKTSSQLIIPMFIRPDTLIYFTSKDQGKIWSYDSTMNIKIDQFLSSNAS